MIEGILPVPVVQVELPVQPAQALAAEVHYIQTWKKSIPSGIMQHAA